LKPGEIMEHDHDQNEHDGHFFLSFGLGVWGGGICDIRLKDFLFQIRGRMGDGWRICPL
jgi:hypothetical protein